ncbi:MAG: cell division FtsA domain-containing protein [Candidatus Saccharimonadales bacterium]
MLDKFKSISQSAAGKAAQGASKAAKSAGKTASSLNKNAQESVQSARTKRKSGKAEYIVALDVGTEFVKALVAQVTNDGEDAEIIGVGRTHQSLSDMQAGAISDIASVVDNCDKALAQAEKQAGVTARTAMIGIAGELVKGTTTAVKFTRKDAAKPMDVLEVEKIIHLVQQKAEARAKEQLAMELGGKDVQVRLVNSALVSIDIDGYKVTNPIGFQGQEVLVQLYTAFAPLIHIGALEKTAQELDLDLLAVAAEPFAVARSIIGDDPNANLSAILMDIGGGTTDIAVIDEGGVQGTKMFGIGGRAFTRGIERDLNVNYEDAEDYKVRLSNQQLPQNKIAPVEAALGKTVDVWINGVELALSEFTKLDSLPHRLLLCGGGSSLDMVMDELHDSDWYKDLAFTRRLDVQLIHPEQIVGITNQTETKIDHTFVTAMGLLRVGLDTLQQAVPPKQSSTVKERLDKMLRT